MRQTDRVTAQPVGAVPSEPDRDRLSLLAVMHALSEPVRLRIVAQLDASPRELACAEFVLPVAKSTSSWHFRVLREAGVIGQREEGTRRLNRLRRTDLDARFPQLLDWALSEDV